MKTMRKTGLLLLLLAFSLTVAAQTPVQLLLKMNETYGKAQSYSMNVEMKFFYGNNDVTPVNTSKGEVRKSGDLYYSSIMGKTTIVNKNCTVFIDDGQKLIVYSKSGDHPSKPPVDDIPDTSSFGSAVKYSYGKGTVTGERVIITPSDKTVYSRIEVVINRKNFTLEEVAYYYPPAEDEQGASVQKVQVTYSSVALNNSIPDDFFSEKKFVVRSKGKLAGVGKYAAYQVVEQDNKLPDNFKK